MFALLRGIGAIKSLASLAIVVGLLWSAFDYGRDSERTRWERKEAKTINEVRQYNADQRKKESLHAVLLSNIGDELGALRDEINKDTSLNHSIASSIASMQLKYDRYQANRTEESRIAAPTKECDGEATTYFSGELFEAISNDFARCDAIVTQLKACQQIIITDRELINEQPLAE